jgi:hypothetical protein
MKNIINHIIEALMVLLGIGTMVGLLWWNLFTLGGAALVVFRVISIMWLLVSLVYSVVIFIKTLKTA